MFLSSEFLGNCQHVHLASVLVPIVRNAITVQWKKVTPLEVAGRLCTNLAAFLAGHPLHHSCCEEGAPYR